MTISERREIEARIDALLLGQSKNPRDDAVFFARFIMKHLPHEVALSNDLIEARTTYHELDSDKQTLVRAIETVAAASDEARPDAIAAALVIARALK